MKLLITNDDGLDSVFLRELVRALRAAGHDCAVVAPAREQSWIGAAKSRHRPVHAASADRGFGCPAWSVDGTPADCVNLALAHLLPAGFRPAAVVSGINVGSNATLGFILASGTLAGAWEGALHGLPGLAFSQEVGAGAYDRLKKSGGAPDAGLLATLQTSAAHAARLVSALAATTPPRSFTVHNVNFPLDCRPDTELRRTVPARALVPALFGPADAAGDHRFVFQSGEDLSPDAPLTDRACLAAGEISHTILDFRRLGGV